MNFTSNICMFSPYRNDDSSIHTINFVYETKKQEYTKLRIEAVYKMYYVCNGTGFLHINGRKKPLKEGDIFFTIPNMPFCIESEKSFIYMYISFIGTKGNMLLDLLKINEKNLVFSELNEVHEFWEKGFNIKSELIDITSESILLYTFAVIGNRVLDLEKTTNKNTDAISLIKKCIDDHFSDTGLSLEIIGKELNYNPKYISSIFKKHIKIGFSEYLNTIRIQHACTLIQQEYTSVSTIARLCGYSDPLYFSRLFKKKMGSSPREYIKTIKR